MSKNHQLKRPSKIFAIAMLNIIFLAFVSDINLTSINISLNTNFAKIVTGSTFATALVTISWTFVNIIPRNIKNMIVFRRLKNPEPSSRVFSQLMKKDNRINPTQLEMELGSIPTDYEKQNNLWYRMYRKVDETARVQLIHRDFLLFRDSSVLCLILSLMAATQFLFGFASTKYVFFAIFTEFLLFNQAAYIRGNEFVSQVIIEYLNKGAK